jgi:hypothetical protein
VVKAVGIFNADFAGQHEVLGDLYARIPEFFGQVGFFL